MINVLFVCLGNICRSPMAEAVFKDLVDKEGLSDYFYIDSVGTAGYHAGEPAHQGTRNVLSNHGIGCHSRSRQVNRTDMEQSDYIVAMDQSNESDLRYMARNITLDGRLYLLLDFAEGSHRRNVPDPYYEGNFETVYRLVASGCRGLLTYIKEENGI